MSGGKNYIIGIYEDDEVVLKAVQAIQQKGGRIHEVYSPFPVHGLENALGYKRSFMPRAAFMFGVLGLSLALILQISTMHLDWPMIIGGKNTHSVAFVPVAFEMTVLITALGMVGTFLIISNLKPWGRPQSFDSRSTDDKHVMAIDLDKNPDLSREQLQSLLQETGASEVHEKSYV